MNKIRVAVIGAGNMGRNHIRTYSSIKNVEVVGLADINEDAKVIAEEYGARFYKDYKKMLNELEPDAVSVVVPTPFHYTIGMDVLNRSIHCLIEKPIASTPEEGDKLITLAEKNKLVFTVGHIEHYNPMIQKLKRLIDKKEIGEITSIAAKRVGGFPSVEPKTDVIIDLAVHDIEIISFLLGKDPLQLYGHGSKTLHSTKIDSAELFLDYGTASGYIQANWITPVKIRNISLTGTKGYVEGNYITQELTYYKHNMKIAKEGFQNFVVTLGEPESYVINGTPEEPLKNELITFINAIRQKETDYSKNGLVDPHSARRALLIALEAIEKYGVAK